MNQLMDQVRQALGLDDPHPTSQFDHLGGRCPSTQVVTSRIHEHRGTHFLDYPRNEASQIFGGQTLDRRPSVDALSHHSYFAGRGRKQR